MRKLREKPSEGLKYWVLILLESGFFVIELMLETGALGMYL